MSCHTGSSFRIWSCRTRNSDLFEGLALSVRYRRVWGSAPAGSFPLISLILHGCAKGQPSKRWPNAVNGRTRSQMIFVIASIGTDNIAPGTPHIQNQKTRDTITRTACSLKARRAETKARRLFCQLRKDGNRAAAKYAPPANTWRDGCFISAKKWPT